MSQDHSFIIPDARPTGVHVGNGAYCATFELDVRGTVCVGKTPHQILLDDLYSELSADS